MDMQAKAAMNFARSPLGSSASRPRLNMEA